MGDGRPLRPTDCRRTAKRLELAGTGYNFAAHDPGFKAMIINPVDQKAIASFTCAAAAILAVLAGISQQLLTRFVRDWNTEPPAMASQVGLGVIAALFLVVIAANAVQFFWVESENVTSICFFTTMAALAALFMIMTCYAFFILRLFSHSSVSP